jgi:hypothetical protein
MRSTCDLRLPSMRGLPIPLSRTVPLLEARTASSVASFLGSRREIVTATISATNCSVGTLPGRRVKARAPTENRGWLQRHALNCSWLSAAAADACRPMRALLRLRYRGSWSNHLDTVRKRSSSKPSSYDARCTTRLQLQLQLRWANSSLKSLTNLSKMFRRHTVKDFSGLSEGHSKRSILSLNHYAMFP